MFTYMCMYVRTYVSVYKESICLPIEILSVDRKQCKAADDRHSKRYDNNDDSDCNGNGYDESVNNDNDDDNDDIRKTITKQSLFTVGTLVRCLSLSDRGWWLYVRRLSNVKRRIR